MRPHGRSHGALECRTLIAAAWRWPGSYIRCWAPPRSRRAGCAHAGEASAAEISAKFHHTLVELIVVVALSGGCFHNKYLTRARIFTRVRDEDSATQGSLKSGLAGLSEGEAQRRLVEFVTNEVEEIADEALLLTFAKEFAHMTLDILGLGKASPFVFPKSRYRKKGSDGGMATRARFYGLLYRKSMENSSTK